MINSLADCLLSLFNNNLGFHPSIQQMSEKVQIQILDPSEQFLQISICFLSLNT
jgi:hypothetical protein